VCGECVMRMLVCVGVRGVCFVFVSGSCVVVCLFLVCVYVCVCDCGV